MTLALFRVELNANPVANADGSGERTSVIRSCENALALKRKAVQEIGFPGRYQRMIANGHDIVPAHVRNLDCIMALQQADRALDPAQARMTAVLLAGFGHQLHADAYAEKWPATFSRR